MDFSLLKKDQLIDIYVPSLQTYYRVKLARIEDNFLVIKESKRQINVDQEKNLINEKLPLNVGKLYLIYIGMDENVYCGKTKLLEIKEDPEEDTSYIVEKPQELTFQERRRGSRVSFTEIVYYKLNDSPELEFDKEAQGIDLSRGGMCLTVSEYFKPKTLLVIKLQIEEVELCVRAKVKWVKEKNPDGFLIGIAFQELFLPI